MSKTKKIIITISVLILLPILIVFIDQFVVYEYIQRKPIPPYSRIESPNALSTCEKIRDNSFKELCISKIKNPDLTISWLSLRPKYGSDGRSFYAGPGIEVYFIEPNPSTDLIAYCNNLISSEKKDDSIFTIYCKAVIINPYWCNKTYLTPLDRILLNEKYSGSEECYQDVAAIWKDPSLCKRTKDKDFCYLRTAVKLIELVLKTK